MIIEGNAVCPDHGTFSYRGYILKPSESVFGNMKDLCLNVKNIERHGNRIVVKAQCPSCTKIIELTHK